MTGGIAGRVITGGWGDKKKQVEKGSKASSSPTTFQPKIWRRGKQKVVGEKMEEEKEEKNTPYILFGNDQLRSKFVFQGRH